MENSPEDSITCPSFSCYSSDKLAEIAVVVAGEDDHNHHEEEEFEFSLVREDTELEFFGNGGIGQIFPVFNRDLLRNHELGINSESNRSDSKNEISLSQLLLEDRENRNDPNSCSSSEADADELEDIPGGTYCVWRPKTADSPSPSQCKKSKSTGSMSKRWKFRDFMKRSNSDGKDSFVFLTPKRGEEEKLPERKVEPVRRLSIKKEVVVARGNQSPSPHEMLYVRNRTVKEGNKKKSYLPYRRDLVGFFANVNGLGRTLPHF